MRPLGRSLFVFSVFSIVAAHISTGILEGFVREVAPHGVTYLNRALDTVLINTFGPEVSVYVLLAIGAFFSLWAYMAATASRNARRQERYSTW